MKTRITTFVSCLLLSISLFGQTCVDQTISTSVWDGELELDPNDFLDGEDPADVYTITPSTVSCEDVGTPITVTIEGPNSFSCTATLNYVDDVAPVVATLQNLVISLAADGTATIFPETIDNGSYDNCTDITLSITPNTFTCDDIGEVEVWLTAEDAYGNWNETWTLVTIEDKTPPEIFANNYVNVSFDQNGEVFVTVDMVEQGGGNLDNCGEVTKAVIPSYFDCSAAGEQNVILTATDESGNVTAKVAVLNLEDKLAPTPVVVNLSTALLSNSPGDLVPTVKVYAEDFDLGSYDNCDIVNMTINKDVFTCEDIGENEVIFTVYDAAGNSNSAVIALTIVDNTTPSNAIACNNEVIYSTFQDLPYTVTPYDVLEGGPYGCNFIFYLEIEDENGDVVPNNLISSDYLGQTLTYAIYDWNSDNTCFGTIIISDEDPECDFDGEDDITWPLDLIELDLLNVDASEVTPDYISNQPQFTYADAFPTVDLDSCSLVGIAYEDIVIPSGVFSYKILRQFTVIDWINFNADTQEGLYEFNQVIKNNNYPAWYICDTLPRSAPLGPDCESGHTLIDHVEWPNDISIEDHRITPTELINYSGIALEDSEPQFSGEDAPFYTVVYQDLVGNLDADILTINRVWTVTHADIPGLDFSYTQELDIVFTQFSNLVAVNTHGNRAVPEVQLSDSYLTNQYGKAIVEENIAINPEFESAALNGLDIVDIYLMREHILGISALSDLQIIAADINNDNMVTTTDLLALNKIIAGVDTDQEAWDFENITSSNNGLNNIKGHYIAIKMGDIDDNALLPGETIANFDQANLSFNDQLLNAGESYTIPFTSTAMINASGIELRMSYDPNVIEITEITSELFGTDLYIDVNPNNGIVTILGTDNYDTHLLDGSEAVIEMKVTALQNEILQTGLYFSNMNRSFFIDENLEKFSINGELENGIVLGTNNDEFAIGINVYPNPTVNFINVDLSKTSIKGDYSISLFNTQGKQVHTQYNDNVVDAQSLPTGSYVLYLSSGENYYSQLVYIQK